MPTQKPACRIEECRKESYRLTGLCRPHARALELYGDPLVKKQQQYHGLSLMERFMKYVVQTPTCWLWVGYKDPTGYGRLNVEDYPELAHRISWTLFRGPIPEGEDVLHDCPEGDNPGCIRPDHLYLGSQLDNVADMYAKGRSAARPGEQRGPLTVEEVRYVRTSTESGKGLAARLQVSEATISETRNYRIWKDIT